MNTMFPNLIMMYADHVLRGLRTLESVPPQLRPDVEWIVNDAKKNAEDEG